VLFRFGIANIERKIKLQNFILALNSKVLTI